MPFLVKGEIIRRGNGIALNTVSWLSTSHLLCSLPVALKNSLPEPLFIPTLSVHSLFSFFPSKQEKMDKYCCAGNSSYRKLSYSLTLTLNRWLPFEDYSFLFQNTTVLQNNPFVPLISLNEGTWPIHQFQTATWVVKYYFPCEEYLPCLLPL